MSFPPRGEIRRSAGNRRLSGKRNGARRNIATAPGDLQTEAIGDFVPPGFVYLDQYVLIRLIRDRPARLDARPIEHADLLQLALPQ